MEMLTVYDEDLKELGVLPRPEAHARGMWHQVVQCWVVSREGDKIWLYFQKRSYEKAHFPGWYDLAVGGHMSAGEDPMTAIRREMSEEIGIEATPEQLEYLGVNREKVDLPDFHDREYAHVYLYRSDAPRFAPGEEVVEVFRVELREFCKKEIDGAPKITGYTLDGAPIELDSGKWCRHDTELERLILPALGFQAGI